MRWFFSIFSKYRHFRRLSIVNTKTRKRTCFVAASFFITTGFTFGLLDTVKIRNWSSTHKVSTKRYFQPDSVEDLINLVEQCHQSGTKLRPVGSSLSPNGIGLCAEGMVSLALLDHVISVDKEKKQVRVQAGARVSTLTELLRPHGLTLGNFASISEQQIGGLIQVGAHGTGVTIPPLDEFVVSMKVITPGHGPMELSRTLHPELFNLFRVGLGIFGIVYEVTLQCVDAHKLVETTLVMTRDQIREHHRDLLKENRHLRYLWIPFTDSVVVITCNPETDKNIPSSAEIFTVDEKLRAPRELLKMLEPSMPNMTDLSFTELRDELIAINPLSRDHVLKVNQAEDYYWKHCQGTRTDYSDRILSFDCGGEQWVLEVAIPIGNLDRPEYLDLDYVTELLNLIETNNIPAPAPIEQRWTANSTSILSPAFSTNPSTVFSWVGIIMYLPLHNKEKRTAISKSFEKYWKLCRDHLWDRYQCRVHWAKMEQARTEEEGEEMRRRLRRVGYPMERVVEARKEMDPNGILANSFIESLFPFPTETTK